MVLKFGTMTDIKKFKFLTKHFQKNYNAMEALGYVVSQPLQ